MKGRELYLRSSLDTSLVLGCGLADKEIGRRFFTTVPKQKADGTMVLNSDPQQGSSPDQNSHIPSIEPDTGRAWLRFQAPLTAAFPPTSFLLTTQAQL